MMELEKQGMEFTKDLEFQRMNMFMDAQLQLEKMNRLIKGTPGASEFTKLYGWSDMEARAINTSDKYKVSEAIVGG
ncbi:hypothetical protein LguiA_016446 [Lonicera macranthoides]